jgi:hypothetical protein
MTTGFGNNTINIANEMVVFLLLVKGDRIKSYSANLSKNKDGGVVVILLVQNRGMALVSFYIVTTNKKTKSYSFHKYTYKCDKVSPEERDPATTLTKLIYNKQSETSDMSTNSVKLKC